MNIRCITIGNHITVQGDLVRIREDGLAVVRCGRSEHVGRLVGSDRRP